MWQGDDMYAAQQHTYRSVCNLDRPFDELQTASLLQFPWLPYAAALNSSMQVHSKRCILELGSSRGLLALVIGRSPNNWLPNIHTPTA